MFNSHSFTRLLFILFFGFIVSSCGSGGLPGESSTVAGNGNVALLLTDAPSDIFEEVNITVTRAELLSDDGKVTLFEGEGDDARTFNLLELTDARIFAIREGVPAGSYNKIRLTLSMIELVDYGDDGIKGTADDAVYNPKLPGNGKLDLKPDDDFEVVADGTLTIQIDMDANKSIHITGTGNDKYQFRPVVFIDIVTDGFEERFVKLHGDISDINDDEQTFKLCNTDIPVRIDDEQLKEDSDGCVLVEVNETTALFASDGQAAGFTDLVDGEAATVFGRLYRDEDDDDENEDESETALGESDDEHEHELDDLVLKAALIELGAADSFLKLNGIATSAVDSNDQFTMDVEPGQSITASDLSVQIQPGTRLINRKGQPVDREAIVTDKLVSVRGVLELGETTVDSDILYASLIVVDTDSSTQYTGAVGDNPDNACGFALNTAVSETGSVNDISVATNDDTKAFLVVDGSSSPVSIDELTPGLSADVYGLFKAHDSGCFAAHTIIAFPAP